MIGTFWNLCRACPSMPVDKLHSEYRSTYRWHEYTGPRQEIIRKPPQNTIIGSAAEPALHRRRKHPELAYRAHDFLVMFDGGSDDFLERTVVYDRARSEERWGVSRQKSSRRSKSEGPPAGQPSYRLIYKKSRQNTESTLVQQNRDRSGSDPWCNGEAPIPADSAHESNTQNKPDMNEKGSTTKVAGNVRNGTSEYRFQFAWPPVSKVLTSQINDSHTHNTPRKSISMNGIKTKGGVEQDTVPVHKKIAAHKTQMEVDPVGTKRPKASDLEPLNTEDKTILETDEPNRKGFKSEYKMKFQPFNNYDFDEDKGIFEKKMVPMECVYKPSEIESPSTSWYKEVVLLRKKANQYRHRGWGTELVPDHIAQLYSNQMMVWEQVSRRSTLSALSLASTIVAKRSSSKEDKDKENRKNSPTKSASRLRSTKIVNDSSGNIRLNKKTFGERSSPKYTCRIPNSSVTPTTHTAATKVPLRGPVKLKRRPRPTSLVTSVPSGSKSSFVQSKSKEETGKPKLLDYSKLIELNNDSAEADVDTKQKAEKTPMVSDEENVPGGEESTDFPDTMEEQIIKSPPEPTRVKSPEQILMRSPEPVNWTVPLDTGKTFTVTQNVREGDMLPRSYSEARAWTPTSVPPPASLSAPPELLELTKTDIPC